MNRALTLALGIGSVALLALGGCDILEQDAMDDGKDMEVSEDANMEDGNEVEMVDGTKDV